MKLTKQRLVRLIKEELRESRWDNIDHERMTEKFRKDVKLEKTIDITRKGDFEYIFTDRYADDEMFYGAITAFHLPSGLYAGDVSIGKWNGESEDYLEGSVQVHPKFRRQRVATTMYDMAERELGKKFKPATDHTKDAQKFWKDRKGL